MRDIYVCVIFLRVKIYWMFFYWSLFFDVHFSYCEVFMCPVFPDTQNFMNKNVRREFRNLFCTSIISFSFSTKLTSLGTLEAIIIVHICSYSRTIMITRDMDACSTNVG